MRADFIIIGSGMAGMSAAYRLSKHGKVIILEKESLLGYHTTGRSAAFFTENYGNKIINFSTISIIRLTSGLFIICLCPNI